jgi:hypothetical protein
MNFIDGNNFIDHHIKNNISCAIGKIGVVELKLLHNYQNQVYTSDVIEEGQFVAGIYPYSRDEYNKFAKIYTTSLLNIDALAVWNTILKDFEISICQHIKAYPIRLQDIEPYFHIPPWSKSLENKKVLVISPFAESIQKQYQIREKIWPNDILPKFDLTVIKYPNASTVDSKNPFKSTIDVIEITKQKMKNVDYDVALIGVGGASIPLTAYAKTCKKIGIHMGGSTQILFGIRGKRWDNIPEFHKFFNEYWIRPSKDETPEKVNRVEGGCYW